MKFAKDTLSKAVKHIEKAKQLMADLPTDDWTATAELEVDFDELERTCRRFIRNQYGINN